MWIELDNVMNVRDLGGLPAADGRTVKPGRLLRGAELGRASDRDVGILTALPLRHVVDFRDPSEVLKRPDREIPGAEYHHMPVLPGLPGGAPPKITSPEPPDFAALFRGLYRKLAESPITAEAYRSYFRVLLDSRDGAVFFHCAQGKDRTGIAALLTLAALGVPQSAACADYYLSNAGLMPELERTEQHSGMNWPREVWKQLFFVWPQFLAEYFDGIMRGWGGTMGYLRGCLGLTDADLARLRDNYLE